MKPQRSSVKPFCLEDLFACLNKAIDLRSIKDLAEGKDCTGNLTQDPQQANELKLL